MHAYIRTYIKTCMLKHTYSLYTQTYKQTNKHPLVHTYVHTSIQCIQYIQYIHTGELRKSWDAMLASVNQTGQTHLNFADKLKNDYQPRIDSFNSRQRKLRKQTEDAFIKSQGTRIKAQQKIERTRYIYIYMYAYT